MAVRQIVVAVALLACLQHAEGSLLRREQASVGKCGKNKCTLCEHLPQKPSALTPTFANVKAMELFAKVETSIELSDTCTGGECAKGEYECKETVEFGPYEGICRRPGKSSMSFFKDEDAVEKQCEECACTWSVKDSEESAVPWTQASSDRLEVLVADCSDKCDRLYGKDSKEDFCKLGCAQARVGGLPEDESSPEYLRGYSLFGTALPNIQIEHFQVLASEEGVSRMALLEKDCLGKCNEWNAKVISGTDTYSPRLSYCQIGCTATFNDGCEMATKAAAAGSADVARGCEFFGTMVGVSAETDA